jgi:hypothetical protein
MDVITGSYNIKTCWHTLCNSVNKSEVKNFLRRCHMILALILLGVVGIYIHLNVKAAVELDRDLNEVELKRAATRSLNKKLHKMEHLNKTLKNI